LTLEGLEERYKDCKHPIEKGRWHIVWLLAKGRNSKEVAEIVGVGPDWVRTLVKRYNKYGPDGLRDRRQNNGGHGLLLNSEQQESLRQALNGPAPDGGLWSGPKVAVWISQLLGRQVHPQRGWDYLKRLGFSQRRPRRRHTQADEQEQESFQERDPAPKSG